MPYRKDNGEGVKCEIIEKPDGTDHAIICVEFKNGKKKFILPDAFETTKQRIKFIDGRKEAKLKRFYEKIKIAYKTEASIDEMAPGSKVVGNKPVDQHYYIVNMSKDYPYQVQTGRVWCPLYAVNGRPYPSSGMMNTIAPGDLIFHISENKEVVSISVAKGEAYDLDISLAGINNPAYNHLPKGRAVDCEYTGLEKPIELLKYEGKKLTQVLKG